MRRTFQTDAVITSPSIITHTAYHFGPRTMSSDKGVTAVTAPNNDQLVQLVIPLIVAFMEKNSPKWKKLLELTEQDVVTIYRKHNDAVVDLETLQYDFMLPLYCKMVFRLRQAIAQSKDWVIGFYTGCDPSNQIKLLEWAGFVGRNEIRNTRNVMDFFMWANNDGLVKDLEDPEKNVAIQWWYALEPKTQQDILHSYTTKHMEYLDGFSSGFEI